MLKYEAKYLKQRIDEVVKCTNGEVSTRLQKKKKKTMLDNEHKLEFIRNGKATLMRDYALADMTTDYNTKPLVVELVKCFTYPTTDAQERALAFNKNLDNKMEDIHTEIELAGKRLLDKAMLKIMNVKDLPDELTKLGEMVSLAG